MTEAPKTIMRPVASSNIREIGYDDRTRTMIITFRKSGTYVYDDVPPSVDADLTMLMLEGGSVGQFFKQHIRDKYRATKIAETANLFEDTNP